MSTLTLQRELATAPETVFAYITRAENVVQWWGPEGMGVKDYKLDLTQTGNWTSTLVNAEGGVHKMSGVVTAIEPPNWMEFTWGWHDGDDRRGHESRVRLEIKSNGSGGSHFVLIHSDLPDDESAKNHGKGWASALSKLERMAN